MTMISMYESATGTAARAQGRQYVVLSTGLVSTGLERRSRLTCQSILVARTVGKQTHPRVGTERESDG